MKRNEALRGRIFSKLEDRDVMSPGERAYAAWLHNMELHAMLAGYEGSMISDKELQEALGHIEAVNYIIRKAAHAADTAMDNEEG